MKVTWAALIVIGLTLVNATEPERTKTIRLPPDNALAKLKPGPGLKQTEAYCRICHSTDYIVRQPRESAQAWQAEVAKMVNAYGGPIPKADAKTISKYLYFTYGAKSSKSGHQKMSNEP